jgi:hypothetical protein
MPIFECCRHCGKEFQPRNKLHKVCEPRCAKKAYVNKDPERKKRDQDKYNRTEGKFLSSIKWRARKNNIPFNLTIEDIVFPSTCPVLGFPLKGNYDGGSGYHRDSPSLDRINPKLGYVKGNVRIISSRANLLKSDATVEELEKVLEDLRRL